MYREIYLPDRQTDRRFNMISRAKKYVAVLLASLGRKYHTHAYKSQ